MNLNHEPLTVIFRKPGEDLCHILHTNSESLQSIQLSDALGRANSFLISGFDFYKSGQVWSMIPERVWKCSLNEIPELGPFIFCNESSENMITTGENEYKNSVEKSISEIKKGSLKKVALSRISKFELRKSISINIIFEKLASAFPNAFVYCISAPQIGTWAGATPEYFLSLHQQEAFTISLAGTKNKDSSDIWTEKEKDEQKIVSDYIEDVFFKTGLDSVKMEGPETFEIGKLRHLRSTFKAKITHNHSKNIIPELIHNLHPTPAVGGIPKEKALDFILNEEAHQRELYTGFLGHIQSTKDLDLFVNLRCFQVLKEAFVFYAGAGITAESDPKKEWIETENKIKMTADLFADYLKLNSK